MARRNLYFIAIIPPDDICEVITEFRQDFSKRFQSSRALKVVPHLTLKAPFQLEQEQEDHLRKWFRELSVPARSFPVELMNFGAFANAINPVIFVQPLISEELLALQTGLIREFQLAYPGVAISPLEFNFQPHITVAYRDLSPEMFDLAWAEYSSQTYRALFHVNRFHLLQHNAENWEVVETYLLQK